MEQTKKPIAYLNNGDIKDIEKLCYILRKDIDLISNFKPLSKILKKVRIDMYTINSCLNSLLLNKEILKL